MTIPDPGTILDDETEAELRREEEVEAISDNFRHIICFLCYPAFEAQAVAPHDAQCICGKPVHAGEVQAPESAPECVLCYEMADGHYRKKHARR
ncbi:hypothetical protein [Actinospica sp.]|jgi:hypothetical protein|uniref:hypothetical protein n=1 Tax=Actinospica sp. TaxID=1872142 RepID=UPI002B82E836|nr:hypothetical protein [Actinospica sp.]HWG22575.1 hypothetical protein [Actinospica sp.]